VGIGHRRLKIIDLQTGRQPLANEDESVWMVLSGEIYNYRELRESLVRSGHRFRSRTDAEVALHLYEERGPDFLDSLRGMFAVAIYDCERKQLLLARDRMGIQPLHYHWEQGNRLLFASEPKSLFCHPCLESKQIHPPSVLKYLLFRYVPAPETHYQGISKLPPGHRLTLQDGRMEIRPYWKLPRMDKELAESSLSRKKLEDMGQELYARLEESVRIHLQSDVPVGLLLSGGVDSTALLALTSRVEPERIRTYSMGFPEPGYDESHQARSTARFFNTEHTEDRMEPDRFMELIPRLVQYRDAPLSEASEVPLYSIVRNAGSQVKVLLTGQGADELFGGYLKYIADPGIRTIQKVLAYFGGAKRLTDLARWIMPGRPRSIRELLTYMGIESDLERWIAYFSSLVPRDLLHRLVSSHRSACAPDGLWNEINTLLEGSGCNRPMDRMMLMDLKYWLPDNLLEGGDRMLLASSVEGRLPFLDHPLVEFVWKLPGRAKVNRLETKILLKSAVRDLVPQGTLHRKKNGFSVPLGNWLRGPLKEQSHDLLFSRNAFHRDFLARETVPGIWKEHQSGRTDHRKILWSLINLEIWNQVR